MASDHPSISPTQFIAVAQREGLLSPDVAKTLTRESLDRNVPPAQLAMQKGMLSLVQVEIVETLLNPRQAIRGYEVLSLLGYGGMGVVYRARQLSLGRIVALKTVMLGANANPDRLSRFEQEAQTVGRLLHPHIITAYDFGQDDGRLYFAMELVEGEDLERRIDRDGPMSEAMVWGLIRQAASGLAQAAEFGVVHRDIKPANLLLVTPPKGFPLPPGLPMVKIADFGLALITDDVEDRTRLTADNTTVGSPHYMAPEQLSRKDVDHRADIYALGATAYHMLAGRPPFDGLSLAQIFSQKLNAEPTPLTTYCDGLSPETHALVKDLLARNPDERIANYATLLDRIDDLLPVSQHKPSGKTPPSIRTISTDTRRIGETLTSSNLFPVGPAKTKSDFALRRMFEFGWRIVVALLLFGGIYYSVAQWWRSPLSAVVRPGVELQAAGYSAPLFDGESINTKWRIMVGNWQTAKDREGATVIAASHGLIMRRLQKEAPGGATEPLTYYRLSFLLDLRQATAVDVTFGMHYSQEEVETRHVLRLEKHQVTLGRGTSESPAVIPVVPPVEMSLEPNHYHEVRIERQVGEWRAYVDNRLISAVPSVHNESQFFRLAVISNSDDHFAHFGDFLLEELVPP